MAEQVLGVSLLVGSLVVWALFLGRSQGIFLGGGKSTYRVRLLHSYRQKYSCLLAGGLRGGGASCALSLFRGWGCIRGPCTRLMERLSNWVFTLCSSSRCGSSRVTGGADGGCGGCSLVRGCSFLLPKPDWNCSLRSLALAQCIASSKFSGNFPLTFFCKTGDKPAKNLSFCKKLGALSPSGRLASHSFHNFRNWASYTA